MLLTMVVTERSPVTHRPGAANVKSCRDNGEPCPRTPNVWNRGPARARHRRLVRAVRHGDSRSVTEQPATLLTCAAAGPAARTTTDREEQLRPRRGGRGDGPRRRRPGPLAPARS